ncbi:hypothetical protein [Streptomyces buecherae]|uniref:hypothetical protein n=1 Tax=Streptomyces buecherae TaxID=2763006 RepID=UPI00379C66A3
MPWLIAASFVAGVGSSLSAIAWDTSLQEHIPTGALSRVSAYDDLLSYLAIPVGLLTIGPLSQSFGPYAVTTVSGLLFIVIVVLPLAAPAVRGLPCTRHHSGRVSDLRPRWCPRAGRCTLCGAIDNESGLHHYTAP